MGRLLRLRGVATVPWSYLSLGEVTRARQLARTGWDMRHGDRICFLMRVRLNPLLTRNRLSLLAPRTVDKTD